MPKLQENQVPSYRLHKQSGQAIVTLSGKDHLLGTHGTKASRAKYDQLIGEWLANGRRADYRNVDGLTVARILAEFVAYARAYYRNADGRATGEFDNFRIAINPLKELYASTIAADFGPRALKALQGAMIKRGWCRTYVNRQIGRIKQVFRWAASQELIPATVYQSLETLPGLRKGKAEVRESAPVRPVAEAWIDAAIPHVSRQVGAMIQLQLLTGTANLRERLTRHALFTKFNKDGRRVLSHPAAWIVSAVDARGEWPGIRPLIGVSDAPILRADGTVWQTAGYDQRTGVLFEPAKGITFPPIHPAATIDDADAAKDRLLEVVCDFRFESEEHRAAWLTALLTIIARFGFSGPSPLFLFDANIRGAGKGLLAQAAGGIALGRELPVTSYSHDPEEMRKKITSIALAGDRVVLLDNLDGTFGNGAIDRALTSTRWKDRILGKSQDVDLPLIPVWFATGNNVQVAADNRAGTSPRQLHQQPDRALSTSEIFISIGGKAGCSHAGNQRQRPAMHQHDSNAIHGRGAAG
jgi:hypothetical protein